MSQLFTSGSQSSKSFQVSITPSNEYSGLISFNTDILAVQGTLKSLLHQHYNLKALILQHSAFFMVQLSHLYTTTGNTIALTLQTLSAEWCVLFNMLSRFVIAFLPQSKCLLISWLQSLSAVILEPKKIKSVTFSTLFPSICHEWWDEWHDLSFLNVDF